RALRSESVCQHLSLEVRRQVGNTDRNARGGGTSQGAGHLRSRNFREPGASRKRDTLLLRCWVGEAAPESASLSEWIEHPGLGALEGLPQRRSSEAASRRAKEPDGIELPSTWVTSPVLALTRTVSPSMT